MSRGDLISWPSGQIRRIFAEERARLSHWRFWSVQGLVIILAGLHLVVEWRGLLPASAGLYFLPEAAFLIPVGYAALNFGLRGSMLTAIWCTLLSLPNLFLWHPAGQFPGALVQFGIVNSVAIFVGQRVAAEVVERGRAEESCRRLQASEARYRALFESSAEAVLVCDSDGVIRQANEAAGCLLATPVRSLPGKRLRDLIDTQVPGRSDGRAAHSGGADLVLIDCQGLEVYVEPVFVSLPDTVEKSSVQVMLRDVTWQRNQREEWRAHVRSMLLCHDHERRRLVRQFRNEMLHPIACIQNELDVVNQLTVAVSGVQSRLSEIRKYSEELAAATGRFIGELGLSAQEETALASTLQRLLAEVRHSN